MSGRSSIRLFDDNPPPEQYVRPLFLNRERELAWGINLLSSGESSGKIWAVHGETRCGKSHLVFRLIEELTERAIP